MSTGKLTDEKKSLGRCKSDRKTSPARAPCDAWRAGWMQLELGNQRQLMEPSLSAKHHERAVSVAPAVVGPGTSAVL